MKFEFHFHFHIHKHDDEAAAITQLEALRGDISMVAEELAATVEAAEQDQLNHEST